jgi:hypothetical protein
MEVFLTGYSSQISIDTAISGSPDDFIFLSSVRSSSPDGLSRTAAASLVLLSLLFSQSNLDRAKAIRYSSSSFRKSPAKAKPDLIRG